MCYNICMKNQKLTPQDRKKIVARVNAGDQQKDVAEALGVSPSLVSRVVNQAKAKKEKAVKPKPKPPPDFSDRTTEQLINRFRECHREILEQNHLLNVNDVEATAEARQISTLSAKLPDVEKCRIPRRYRRIDPWA